MSITPVKVSPIPRSVSDASMGYNEDDMLDSPPTRGMPDVRALADALEPPPDMAALTVQKFLIVWDVPFLTSPSTLDHACLNHPWQPVKLSVPLHECL